MKVLTCLKDCHGGTAVLGVVATQQNQVLDMVSDMVENVIEDACEDQIEKITGTRIDLDSISISNLGFRENARVWGTGFMVGVVLSRLVSNICCCGIC